MLLCIGSLAAQAQSFRMHLKSGETLSYECNDVDSIVFDAPAQASPTFTLEYSDVTMTSANLSVTPSDNSVRYYFDVITTEQLAETDGGIPTVVEEYVDYIQQTYPTLSLENVLDALLSKGPDSDAVSNLPAGTDFVFYAIAVDDEGKCYGQASTTTFSTLPGGDPADCSFEISYEDLTTEGLTVIVTPSDNSVSYWMGITAVSDYPGDYAQTIDVQTTIEEYAASYNMTVEQVVKGVTFTGETETAESGLSADTDYYIYVYAMDEAGAAAGSVYKKKFTTNLTDYSAADISLKYRYFNGDSLYKSDPETYANLSGRVYVQVVVTPNADAANWAVGLASGDMTDETTYPEESTKNAVLQGGFLNASEKFLVADWKTCTFLYFAADESGIDGALHRLLVTFDKENARPISELSSTITTEAVKTLHKPSPRRKSSILFRRMHRSASAMIHRSVAL